MYSLKMNAVFCGKGVNVNAVIPGSTSIGAVRDLSETVTDRVRICPGHDDRTLIGMLRGRWVSGDLRREG